MSTRIRDSQCGAVAPRRENSAQTFAGSPSQIDKGSQSPCLAVIESDDEETQAVTFDSRGEEPVALYRMRYPRIGSDTELNYLLP
jgi:hypothetical protein